MQALRTAQIELSTTQRDNHRLQAQVHQLQAEMLAREEASVLERMRHFNAVALAIKIALCREENAISISNSEMYVYAPFHSSHPSLSALPLPPTPTPLRLMAAGAAARVPMPQLPRCALCRPLPRNPPVSHAPVLPNPRYAMAESEEVPSAEWPAYVRAKLLDRD